MRDEIEDEMGSFFELLVVTEPVEPVPSGKPTKVVGVKAGKAQTKLRPMNLTIRNLMSGREHQAYSLFETWARDGCFYCSGKKLAVVVTGKPTADKVTGQRLITRHRAAGVIEPDGKGRGRHPNWYRLVPVFDHAAATAVYRAQRATSKALRTELGFLNKKEKAEAGGSRGRVAPIERRVAGRVPTKEP